MSAFGRRPVAIIHYNYKREDNFTALADRCSFAMHLAPSEHRLLRYYASCASGFRPAAGLITKALNISEPCLYLARNALVKHGLAYMQDDSLHINWDRVKLFASMDPAKTSKRAFIAPINPYVIARLEEIVKLDPSWILEKSIEEVIADFAAMTEAEYKSVRRAIKRKKGLI